MDLGLAGKTVVVTGATANIGRAIALEMATEGVKLVACGRDREAGDRVVREALARGAADARFIAADLLDKESADRIIAEAIEAFGQVDVLVNNVGGNFVMGEFAGTDPDSWDKDIDITFGTVLRMTRAVLPGMIARKSGRIVNIGSTAGDVGDTFLAVYSAAKGAVHAFTRVLAKEIGPHGLTVNCVAPYFTLSDDPAALSSGSRFKPETGFFPTAMGSLSPEQMARMGRTGPLDRTIAKPEEVAAAVLYLASDRAAFTTGQIVYIDGGTRLWSRGLFDLGGKTALVTGGNGGLGLAYARGLAKHGADAILWGRNAEKNAAAVAEIEALGVKAFAQTVDVSDEQQVIAGFAEAVARVGRLDIVIQNAGFSNPAPSFVELTTEAYRAQMSVAMDGGFYTLREAARHMKARAEAGDPPGSIILCGSGSVFQGIHGMEHYGAAKAGLASMMRGMASELAPLGIRVNMIAPGYIDTELGGSAEIKAFMASRTPMLRLGDPADVEAAAVYLASDAARYHTGDILVIDGGWLASYM